jgi:hypothetical protein
MNSDEKFIWRFKLESNDNENNQKKDNHHEMVIDILKKQIKEIMKLCIFYNNNGPTEINSFVLLKDTKKQYTLLD